MSPTYCVDCNTVLQDDEVKLEKIVTGIYKGTCSYCGGDDLKLLSNASTLISIPKEVVLV